MTERSPGRSPDRAEVERLLVELGRELAIPPSTDPSERVLARLATEPRRRRGWRTVALVAATVVALLALTPPGQAAVARVVELFGVVLRVGEPVAPQRPERLPGESTPSAGPTAGTARTAAASALNRATAQVSFPVLVPAALGAPDQVTVSDEGRVLSLIYGPGPGRPPAGPDGVSARLDQFDGTLDPVFAKTVGAAAEFVDLPGGLGVWIAAPHDVTYLDRNGLPHNGSARLAARTLIWQSGSVTLRLEGNFTRDDALAVARSTARP